MKIYKDYNSWSNKKIIINDIKNTPYFHEREIWFCFLGVNIGFEQDGSGSDFQRPILIIKKFSKDLFWALPLSKTKKRGDYYFSFNFVNDIISVAVLTQIRLIDVRRLSRKIGYLDLDNFGQIIEKLKGLFP